MNRRSLLGLAPALALAPRPAAAPLVPALPAADPLARLAARYARLTGLALALNAAEYAVDDETWDAACSAFDRAEAALFRAMRARGLFAFEAGGRVFVDIQLGPNVPDRPSKVCVYMHGDLDDPARYVGGSPS